MQGAIQLSFAIPIDQKFDFFQLIRAVSKEAALIDDEVKKVKRHEEAAISLGWKTSLKDEIDSFLKEFSVEDSDSEIIDRSSAFFAKRFIDTLPESVISPELSPEGNGISIDWHKGRKQVLSVSIEGNQILFAGIFGNKKIHGETEVSDELPEDIQKLLSKFFLKR